MIESSSEALGFSNGVKTTKQNLTWRRDANGDIYFLPSTPRLDAQTQTKPGHHWVDDKRVKQGGYWRKNQGARSRSGKKVGNSIPSNDFGKAIAAGAAIAGVAAIGAGAAAYAKSQAEEQAGKPSKKVIAAVGAGVAAAGIAGGAAIAQIGKEQPGKQQPGKQQPGKQQPGKQQPSKQQPTQEEANLKDKLFPQGFNQKYFHVSQQSRGTGTDHDYAWSDKQFIFKPEELQLVDAYNPYVLAVKRGGLIQVQIGGMDSGTEDFRGRRIRNSVRVTFNDKDEALVRGFIAKALRNELEEPLKKLIKSNDGIDLGHELDQEGLAELIDSSALNPESTPANENANFQQSPSTDDAAHWQKRNQIADEISQSLLPERNGVLVATSHIGKQERFKELGVWRGIGRFGVSDEPPPKPNRKKINPEKTNPVAVSAEEKAIYEAEIQRLKEASDLDPSGPDYQILIEFYKEKIAEYGDQESPRLDAQTQTKPGHHWVDDKRVKEGGYWRKNPGGAGRKVSNSASTNKAWAAGAAGAAIAAIGAGAVIAHSKSQAESNNGKVIATVGAGVAAASVIGGGMAIAQSQAKGEEATTEQFKGSAYAFPSNQEIESNLKPLNHSDATPSGYDLFTAQVGDRKYFVKKQPAELSYREAASYNVAQAYGLESYVLPAKVMKVGGVDHVASPFLEGSPVGLGSAENIKRIAELRVNLEQVEAQQNQLKAQYKSGELSSGDFRVKRIETSQLQENLQLQIKQAKVDSNSYAKEVIQSIEPKVLKKLVMYDYLNNIADRHTMNLYRTTDGELKLIDNALTFHDAGADSGFVTFSQELPGGIKKTNMHMVPPSTKMPSSNSFIRYGNIDTLKFDDQELDFFIAQQKQAEAGIRAALSSNPKAFRTALTGFRKRMKVVKQMRESQNRSVKQLVQS